MQHLIKHPWVDLHMSKPIMKNTAQLRLISRTDSFSDSRSMFGIPQLQGAGEGGGSGPEEMVHNMQVRAIQQSGHMLGHSNSMNAADMLRWRDIAFNADPENTYGDPSSAAVAAAGALKRMSDSGLDGPDGRRPSMASAARLAAGCSPRTPVAGSPAMSRADSGMLFAGGGGPGASGESFGSRPMSREELFASLQASAQRLNRSGSFTSQRSSSQASPSPLAAAAVPGTTSYSHRPGSPNGSPLSRSQSSSLAVSPQNAVQIRQGSASGTPPSHHLSSGKPAAVGYGGMASQQDAVMNDLSKLRTSGDSSAGTLPQYKISGSGTGAGGGSIYRPQQPAPPGLQRSVGGAAPFSPSRLSTSFTMPSSPMAGRQVPASGAAAGIPRMMRPAPPEIALSPSGASPRTNSFSMRAAGGLSPVHSPNSSPSGGGMMQAPVPMVADTRLGVASPRSLDDEMDAIMSQAESNSSNGGTPTGGIFGGIKKVFGS